MKWIRYNLRNDGTTVCDAVEDRHVDETLELLRAAGYTAHIDHTMSENEPEATA